MNILILGGDQRYIEIIEHLSLKNNVDAIGYKNYFINNKIKNISLDKIDINKYNVIIFPINGVQENNTIKCRFSNSFQIPNNLLINAKKDVLIFSGIPTPNLENILNTANKKCYYLMKDKEIIKKNIIPTVEGIIADIIINTEKTIQNSKITVFGYGNIGKTLVNYLKMLGANVSVAIIKEEDKKTLEKININSFYSYNKNELIENIKNTDIIINTVPSTIIEEPLIKYINRNSYVLDIASHPHGISREVLDTLFIKNKLYLGIPGKVAPITSGKILTKKINEILEGKK